jgi:hypothetical protein
MENMNADRVWYKAKLLPAAQSIFTEGFYPEVKKRTGSQYVYFTQVDPTPTNSKVLIASRFAENSFRMLTLELAKHCLEPQEKATRAEIQKLNELSSFLERNI